MKRRWWIIPVAFVLLLVVVLAACWDAIAIRLMPNVVLSKAIMNTLNAMEVRLENSPLKVVSGGIDMNGCNSVDLQLDTTNEILGDIRYQMNVQMMGNPRKLNAKGTVSSADGAINLTIYADKDFAAVSSQNLLDGKFYGITYDTFSEDIRSIPLLPFLIGEKTLNQWEQSVSDLQAQMGQVYNIPEFSKEDIQSALLGILVLKPQAGNETLTINGQDQKVHKLTYSATGQQIASIAGNYVQHISPEILDVVKKFANDPNSVISASFFVFGDSVCKISLDAAVDGETLQLELILGQDPALDPVKLAFIRHSDTVLDKWSVDVRTSCDDSSYSENWTVIHIENGIQNRNIIDYSWDISGGDMHLNVTGGAGETSLLLNLQPTENGFRLVTEQLETLFSLFSDAKKTGNSACVMYVTKGTEVITPGYKNIDQWTGDDLLSLLESIGVLLGLQI